MQKNPRFLPTEQFKGATTAPLDDRTELELKALTSKKKAKRVRNHFMQKGMIIGKIGEKILVSSYFDDPEYTLNKNGINLRIRHELDLSKLDGVGGKPDISIKAKQGSYGGALNRVELEASLPQRTPQLDFSPLIDKFGVEIIESYLNLLDGGVESLREQCWSICKRQYYKVGIDVGNEKQAVFEICMDDNEFFAKSADGDVITLGDDIELEIELKMANCQHDKDPAKSSPDLTPEEALKAFDTIREIAEEKLKKKNSTKPYKWNLKGKAERGIAYRKEHPEIELLPVLTTRGTPLIEFSANDNERTLG